MNHKLTNLLSVAMCFSLISSFSYGQDHDAGHHDHMAAHAEHHDQALHAEHHANEAAHDEHHGHDLAQAEQNQSPYLAMGLEHPSDEFTKTHSRLVAEATLALAEAVNTTEIVQWPYKLASDEVKAIYDYNREAIRGLVPLYKLAMQDADGSVLIKVLEDMADRWYAIRQLHSETLDEDEVALLDQTYSNILDGH